MRGLIKTEQEGIEQDDFELKPNCWLDDLIRCPSQCYYLTKQNDTDYILYLRWRHGGYWQGHIIKNANSENGRMDGEWSKDLFSENKIFIPHDDMQEAKEKLFELFEKEVQRQ